MVDVLSVAMRRASQKLASHIKDKNLGEEGYQEYLAALADVGRKPGADDYAAAIASARLTAALVYNRSQVEVEKALVDSLETLAPLDFARLHAAAAAYATYPQLRHHFEREAMALRTSHPDPETRTHSVEFAERVRANAQGGADD
ncbi:MAG: hypothetical protein Tsb0020_32450 [Haliangiales bacterium]